jgi:hypothetical protein
MKSAPNCSLVHLAHHLFGEMCKRELRVRRQPSVATMTCSLLCLAVDRTIGEIPIQPAAFQLRNTISLHLAHNPFGGMSEPRAPSVPPPFLTTKLYHKQWRMSLRQQEDNNLKLNRTHLYPASVHLAYNLFDRLLVRQQQAPR